jgi:hypothetical protein
VASTALPDQPGRRSNVQQSPTFSRYGRRSTYLCLRTQRCRNVHHVEAAARGTTPVRRTRHRVLRDAESRGPSQSSIVPTVFPSVLCRPATQIARDGRARARCALHGAHAAWMSSTSASSVRAITSPSCATTCEQLCSLRGARRRTRKPSPGLPLGIRFGTSWRSRFRTGARIE